MIGLQIVIVDLQRAVRPCSSESHHVILIVIHFHTDLTDRMIVRPHIVNSEHVSFHLESNEKYN